MYLLKKNKCNYDIVHDNLNNMWLIADLSNKKYQFYYKYNLSPKHLERKKPTFTSLSTERTKLFITSLVILLTILFLNNSFIDFSNEKTYKNFYKPYPILSISRSTTIDYNDIQSALYNIENKEYDVALEKLKTITNNDKNNIIAHFYTGSILQETGKYQKAIEEYNIVIKNNDNLFIDQSKWYIGLCYLKMHRNTKAMKYFNQLSNDNAYRIQIKEITSEIK